MRSPTAGIILQGTMHPQLLSWLCKPLHPKEVHDRHTVSVGAVFPSVAYRLFKLYAVSVPHACIGAKAKGMGGSSVVEI